jgi:hypothetical protein
MKRKLTQRTDQATAHERTKRELQARPDARIWFQYRTEQRLLEEQKQRVLAEREESES